MEKLLLKITRHSGSEELPEFHSRSAVMKFLTLLPISDGEADWDLSEQFQGKGFTMNFENRQKLLEYLKYE